MPQISRILLVFIILISQFSFGQSTFEELIKSNSKKKQNKLIKTFLNGEISADSIIFLIKNIKYKKPEQKGIVCHKYKSKDGRSLPYYMYIPEKYDNNKKHPLLIYLHGGVTKNVITKKSKGIAVHSPFKDLAEKNGYILLFPIGDSSSAWWDNTGIFNILYLIKETKKNYNINDNKVFMTGFSDGGSISFFFAMIHPTNFAGFIPLSGSPITGSKESNIQNYLPNLSNRPLYVVNTDIDLLFPDNKIKPIIDLAKQAGGNISYKIYKGIGHNFSYAEQEVPLIFNFMEHTKRNLFPETIIWETDNPKRGKCMWFIIDKINDEKHEIWYHDYNNETVENKLNLGFTPDFSYTGKGIKIAKIIEKHNLCTLFGLENEDVIIQIDDKQITNLNVLYDIYNSKITGDNTKIIFNRCNKKQIVEKPYPPPRSTILFNHDNQSAYVETNYKNNIFKIKSSKLAAFTIFIHPEMVNVEKNIVIYNNDKIVFDSKIKFDKEFLLNNFLKNRDRALIYINKISIELE
ncbi:MAG: dienelactone hydrolase family protein [Bacteroidales bacterium]|nr:dienelactone hydrolase family protein [Bacteroidales bacterium]